MSKNDIVCEDAIHKIAEIWVRRKSTYLKVDKIIIAFRRSVASIDICIVTKYIVTITIGYRAFMKNSLKGGYSQRYRLVKEDRDTAGIVSSQEMLNILSSLCRST